jgi:hypothetical protein
LQYFQAHLVWQDKLWCSRLIKEAKKNPLHK